MSFSVSEYTKNRGAAYVPRSRPMFFAVTKYPAAEKARP